MDTVSSGPDAFALYTPPPPPPVSASVNKPILPSLRQQQPFRQHTLPLSETLRQPQQRETLRQSQSTLRQSQSTFGQSQSSWRLDELSRRLAGGESALSRQEMDEFKSLAGGVDWAGFKSYLNPFNYNAVAHRVWGPEYSMLFARYQALRQQAQNILATMTSTDAAQTQSFAQNLYGFINEIDREVGVLTTNQSRLPQNGNLYATRPDYDRLVEMEKKLAQLDQSFKLFMAAVQQFTIQPTSPPQPLQPTQQQQQQQWPNSYGQYYQQQQQQQQQQQWQDYLLWQQQQQQQQQQQRQRLRPANSVPMQAMPPGQATFGPSSFGPSPFGSASMAWQNDQTSGPNFSSGIAFQQPWSMPWLPPPPPPLQTQPQVPPQFYVPYNPANLDYQPQLETDPFAASPLQAFS